MYIYIYIDRLMYIYMYMCIYIYIYKNVYIIKKTLSRYAHTRATILASFGMEIEELFDEFEDKPVASGTIAQVRERESECVCVCMCE